MERDDTSNPLLIGVVVCAAVSEGMILGGVSGVLWHLQAAAWCVALLIGPLALMAGLAAYPSPERRDTTPAARVLVVTLSSTLLFTAGLVLASNAIEPAASLRFSDLVVGVIAELMIAARTMVLLDQSGQLVFGAVDNGMSREWEWYAASALALIVFWIYPDLYTTFVVRPRRRR